MRHFIIFASFQDTNKSIANQWLSLDFENFPTQKELMEEFTGRNPGYTLIGITGITEVSKEDKERWRSEVAKS